MPGPPDVLQIRRLVVTRQFALSCERLSPYAVTQLEKALTRLQESPGDPAVKLRALAFPDGHHELRFAHRDRVTIRIDGETAILLDVAPFLEVARLNARAARYLRFMRQR